MDLVTAYNGALLRMGLYLLIFWPTVGYYIYHDSKKQGFSFPAARAVGLGFLGLLGFFIYEAMKRLGQEESETNS